MKYALTALALVLAAPAYAADMPAAPKTTAAAKNAYAADTASWSGFYAGGHFGYGWGTVSPEIDITPFSDPKPKGWAYGGHVGYLWQWAHVAGGLEIDYSGADIKQDQSAALVPGVANSPTIGLSTKFDALASARGRAGVIIGDMMYVYGTGGLAFAKSKATVNFCSPDCVLVASASENHWGWVAGGGVEFKPINNIIFGVEALHYDFGTQQHNFALNPALLPPITLGIKADSTVDVVRGRASIRF